MNCHTTHKAGLLLTVFAAVLMWAGLWANVAQAAKQPIMVPEGKFYLISYQLDGEDDSFWTAVHDGVRAGRQVMVTHTVKIKPRKFTFWGTLARQDWHKYVVYNLFENAYRYGVNEETARRTTIIDVVQKYVMGIDDMPLIARHKLVPGDAYTITITLEVTERSEEESWLRYMPLQNLFKKKLTRSFTYVAGE